MIAGGGFGGFYAARTLARALPPHSARITLVNDVNFMLYTPLLPGAAAGTLEPRHVVVPLREALDGAVDLRLGCITGASPERRRLHVRLLEGREDELPYDHVIVTLGSVSRTLPVPGLAEHGVGFKSLPEAIALCDRVVRSFEMAEALESDAERREHLTYVFVGAGYAGLEGLAELQDFAVDVIDLYPRCRTTGMRWILVEATERAASSPTPPGPAAGRLEHRAALRPRQRRAGPPRPPAAAARGARGGPCRRRRPGRSSTGRCVSLTGRWRWSTRSSGISSPR